MVLGAEKALGIRVNLMKKYEKDLRARYEAEIKRLEWWSAAWSSLAENYRLWANRDKIHERRNTAINRLGECRRRLYAELDALKQENDAPVIPESRVKAEILAALNTGSTRLINTPVGEYKTLQGDGRIRIGFEGMSDTTGFHSVTITPDMVGRTVAIYLCIETKTKNHRTKKDRLEKQTRWIEFVRSKGGIAGFANSVEQAKALLLNFKGCDDKAPSSTRA